MCESTLTIYNIFISGYLAQGQYFVSLPDGRLQTVTYHADGNGYVADVTYQGQPVSAPLKPTYYPLNWKASNNLSFTPNWKTSLWGWDFGSSLIKNTNKKYLSNLSAMLRSWYVLLKRQLLLFILATPN
jgi:hypothetical protein